MRGKGSHSRVISIECLAQNRRCVVFMLSMYLRDRVEIQR